MVFGSMILTGLVLMSSSMSQEEYSLCVGGLHRELELYHQTKNNRMKEEIWVGEEHQVV